MTYRLPMVALGRLIATAAVGQCWVWLVATGTFGLFLVALVIHHRREAQTLLRREAEPGLGEQRPVITVSRLQAIARVCGLCVMALGALVLASWQVGNQTPKVIAHGVAPMNLPAVLAFILAGAALFFQTPRRTGTWRRLPQAAALAVAFIGLLRISDCFGWNPHLEQVMFRGVLAGNHMSPNAAACFLLAGLALAMLDTSGLRRRRFANGLALGGIAIAAAALVGYVFDAGNLYKIGDYPTALISDVALAMLFLGTLCARPENEIIARLTSVSIGGVMLRTLLPASIGIPIVLGGLRLLGQRMGLYGTEVGITLSTLSTIIILLIVVWWNAGLLHGLDIRRRQIQTAIIKTRDDLSRRVEERTAELTEANASLQRQIAVRQQREEELALGQKRANTLLRLTEMTDSPLQDITDLALESAVEFTKSQIGYLAFLNDDETILTMHSWSKTAMERCRMENKPLVYPVATTGLWGEAVRQRKAVITNDYAAANPLKKGTPHGHVEIKRHMNVPIFEDKHLMAVIGVANKEEPYDDQDEVLLRLLMNEAGRVIEHQRADEEIRQLNAELERQVVQRTAQYESALKNK